MSEKAWENNRREQKARKKLGIPWCYFMYIRLFPLILLIFWLLACPFLCFSSAALTKVMKFSMLMLPLWCKKKVSHEILQKFYKGEKAVGKCMNNETFMAISHNRVVLVFLLVIAREERREREMDGDWWVKLNRWMASLFFIHSRTHHIEFHTY